VSQLGEYQVSVANLNGSCEVIQSFQVFESEPPTITAANITVVEGTSNNSITIDEAALGSANYEFELIDENGNLVAAYQDLGYFDQLSGGFYSLYIRDELQCEEIVITIPVLYVPNFFTPNNDGFNDVWGIKGVVSGAYIFSKISIFDRYGKLLKTMSINQNFWDGTHNGALLPTNDYWYAIELTKSDGSVFIKQGHFTLRR
jgi:gliding motility-associated-like protein